MTDDQSLSSSRDPVEFDAFAANYDEALARGLSATGEDKDYYASERLIWLVHTLAGTGLEPKRILDFGCGTGSAAVFIRRQFPRATIVGVDVSAASVDRARQLHAGEGISFFTLAEHRQPASADLAFCNGVFHHIPPAERTAALAYVRQALRPGGLFAFWENNPLNPGTRYVMSRIPFDRDAILIRPGAARRMLAGAGYDVLRTDHRFFFPAPLAALRGLEPWLAKVPFGGQYQVLARRI